VKTRGSKALTFVQHARDTHADGDRDEQADADARECQPQALLNTSHMTSPGVEPIAMRMPISRVRRRATTYACHGVEADDSEEDGYPPKTVNNAAPARTIQ